MAKRRNIFQERLDKHIEELRELYLGLYDDEHAFEYFLGQLKKSYTARKQSLRKLDEKREADPGFYNSNKMLGMMLYTENFGGDLNGVREKLPYLKECGVNYLHLMPLLDSPEGKSDGGYAVSDFRKVRPDLGTMDDLEELTGACHRRGMMVCLDFVMNHTSEEHEWAKAARSGDIGAQQRYFFYDDWDIPNAYSKTLPEVFPETAPGNYTYLEDCNKIVMTSFYPFQWDLNYANPMVFNDMTDNLMYLANRGVDVVRLDAVPYIWKSLGTNCRNLPEVHVLVRMMNLACRIVCPGVILLGEVVMEPKEVVPYFGTPEKPECDMLYNVTTMCTIWHTLATRDVKLRCHDDIGWGLDYGYLGWFGITEAPHKKYLNDYFTGRWPGSPARGELYNDSEVLRDARLCGTTASLCGIEAAIYERNENALVLGVAADIMLHALMFTLKGIPVLYSGDEIGMLNDYSYHEDPKKADDSRFIHRGKFDWELSEERNTEGTVQNTVFSRLSELEEIRKFNDVFRSDGDMFSVNTGSDQILGIGRSYGGKTLLGLFNFTPDYSKAVIENAAWDDLTEPDREFTQGEGSMTEYWLEPYGFRWLLK